MNKIGDLTNQRFGKLRVLEYAGMLSDYQKVWLCQCDCGTTKVIRQQHLLSGHTTTCGCGKSQLNDYIGKRFGHLTVISRAGDYICPKNHKHYVMYNCLCDCGNKTVAMTSNLKKGSTISCGCKRPHAFVDLSGQRFGYLTVEKRVDDYVNPKGRKLIRYLCKCDCGNEIYALANTLRSHDVCSCGCKVYSRGEELVANWLSDNNIKYESHKTFSECVSDIGNKLSYDFWLPELNALIECNGKQHYEPVEFFGGEMRFVEQQRHDELKALFAQNNNYSYLVLDCRKIDETVFIDKLNEFIVTLC